jgi:hypothetical protein
MRSKEAAVIKISKKEILTTVYYNYVILRLLHNFSIN